MSLHSPELGAAQARLKDEFVRPQVTASAYHLQPASERFVRSAVCGIIPVRHSGTYAHFE